MAAATLEAVSHEGEAADAGILEEACHIGGDLVKELEMVERVGEDRGVMRGDEVEGGRPVGSWPTAGDGWRTWSKPQVPHSRRARQAGSLRPVLPS